MSGIAEKWYLEFQEKRLHHIEDFEQFNDKVRNQFEQAHDLQTLYSKLVACVQ